MLWGLYGFPIRHTDRVRKFAPSYSDEPSIDFGVGTTPPQHARAPALWWLIRLASTNHHRL